MGPDGGRGPVPVRGARVFIAPAGTDPADRDAWEQIGYVANPLLLDSDSDRGDVYSNKPFTLSANVTFDLTPERARALRAYLAPVSPWWVRARDRVLEWAIYGWRARRPPVRPAP